VGELKKLTKKKRANSYLHHTQIYSTTVNGHSNSKGHVSVQFLVFVCHWIYKCHITNQSL